MGTSPYRCCSDSCTIMQDAFERTEVGPCWIQLPETWSIDGYDPEQEGEACLKEPGESGVALAVAQPPNPEAITGNVMVWIMEPPDNSKHRVGVNLRENGDGYWAQYELVDGEEIWTLIMRVGGQDYVLLQRDNAGGGPGQDAHLNVCFGPVGESGKVIFATGIGAYWKFQAWTCVVPFEDGYRAGLGNGGDTPVRFDDFQYEMFHQPDGSCLECLCGCGSTECMPMSLTATWVNVDGCESIDGHQEILTPYEFSPDGPDIEWALTGDNDWCPCDTNCFAPILHCQAAQGLVWLDDMMGQGCNPISTSGSPYPNPQSTCDPLYLVFGPFEMDEENCECCRTAENPGTFNIVITA